MADVVQILPRVRKVALRTVSSECHADSALSSDRRTHCALSIIDMADSSIKGIPAAGALDLGSREIRLASGFLTDAWTASDTQFMERVLKQRHEGSLDKFLGRRGA
jgi:hypothetical protein